MLQTIAERGRALIDRTRDRREVAEQRSAGLVQLCEELLSGRGEASGVALAREILARYGELTTGPRIAFFEALATRFGPDRERLERRGRGLAERARRRHRRQAASRRPSRGGSSCSAASIWRPTAPPRWCTCASNCSTPWIIATTSRPSTTISPPVLVLVQPRLPGAAPDRLVDAGAHSREDHPLRGGARDPRLERSAPPHRFARPALLRVLPSGAGRRAADLRRGRAHARHPGGDRADPHRRKRDAVEPERATTAVFYSISNCQRGLAGVSFGHFLIKQVVEEIAREMPRLSTFVTLSPAPDFAEWLKRERAPKASVALERGGPRGARRARSRRLVARRGDRASWCTSRCCARPPGTSCAPGRRAATRSIRLRASISATAPGSSGSIGSPTRSERAIAQSHGLMVNYLYDLEDIEKNHEAYAQQRAVVAASAVTRLLRSTPARDVVPAGD